MSRITELFESDREKKRFIAYVCALDPDAETSLEVCKTLIQKGVDILELGVPFSDPLADGKTNQLAAERALSAGATPDQVLDLVKEIREFSEIPIVLYTYYNLVFQKGVSLYVEESKRAGVDGLLALDLPPEESAELTASCKDQGMDQIFLIAPTTPNERIPTLVKDASGFVYYVSREGVTGERSDVASDIKERVGLIKEHCDVPVGVGFGISNGEQVRQVAADSDAVIVGSTIVKIVQKYGKDTDNLIPALESKLDELLGGLS